MFDVLDLGYFPEVNQSYLWLTILVPGIIYVIVCVWAAKADLKNDNDIGVYVFGFIIMLFVAILGTTLVGSNLHNQRWTEIYDSVETVGYDSVVILESGQGAALSAIDENGKGVLLNFVSLPEEHVGVVEVGGK